MPAGGAHAADAVPGGGPRQGARVVLLLIVATGLLRVALAALLGLSVDESYTVAISRDVALSYFDHPPLHVWLLGGWARLWRSEQPWLLRLPDIAMFAASTWLMYRLTAAAYGERAGMWAALSLNLAPLFTLNAAGGILPDGPLTLCSLLAARCFMRAVLEVVEPPRAFAWMLGAGAATGLALLSKYTAVSLPLSLGLYLVSCRPHALKGAAPWLALLIAALLFTPVVAWNAAHHWVSFAFQLGRARALGLDPARALWDTLGELLYLLPWIAVALLMALWRALRRGPADPASWLFVCLAALPLLAFTVISLWAPVLPHWAALGWLFAFPLLGCALAESERRRARPLWRTAAASAGFLLVLVAAFVSQAATGWIERLTPEFAAHDPTVDFLDWRGLKRAVASAAARRPDLVVTTVSWIDAGKADYALDGAVPVLCLSADPRGFSYLRDAGAYRGRAALLLAPASRADWLRLAAPHFERIVGAEDVVLTRAGRAALTLHTAYGYGIRSSVRPTRR
jgi:4-amino-4-deoxy-L-arabinose transferase-like glycosyltransferase